MCTNSLSYIPIKVHLVLNYNLAGEPLELPHGPLGVPGPHFENMIYNTEEGNTQEQSMQCCMLNCISIRCTRAKIVEKKGQ